MQCLGFTLNQLAAESMQGDFEMSIAMLVNPKRLAYLNFYAQFFLNLAPQALW